MKKEINKDIGKLKLDTENFNTGKGKSFALKEHYKTIDERRDLHLKGKSKSYTWEEVKQNMKNATKKK